MNVPTLKLSLILFNIRKEKRDLGFDQIQRIANELHLKN